MEAVETNGTVGTTEGTTTEGDLGRGRTFWSGATRLALGRHALSLVARSLRERGIHQVVVPDHHCLTMVRPFQLEGMHVAHVALGPDLLADPVGLRAAVGGAPRSWAVLHCETFGASPSPDLADALTELTEGGAALVVDATHTWPLAPTTPGVLPAGTPSACLASVRKFARLPDGALLTSTAGTVWPNPGRTPRDEDATLAWMRGDEDAAEDLMEDQLAPASMSEQAREMLGGLDLAALLATHRSGARILERGLRARGFTPLGPRGAHFCTAFAHPEGPALVEALAREGIDGPVWWPRPHAWTRPWPDGVVTLPNDSAPRAREVLEILDHTLRRNR